MTQPPIDPVAKVYPRALPVGEAAFTIELGDRIDVDVNRRVHALDASLASLALPGVIECVPSYRSLLVKFDPRVADVQALRTRVLELAAERHDVSLPEPGRLVEVPVHYGGEDGPDLVAVAAHTGLREDQVIARHSAVTYRVAMLGFAPGFTYLLGLPAALATPRLRSPRTHVPPGSVGIAGGQTGMYALDTPGGWRIIGRTRLTLFDASREDPFLIHAGDRVRFVPC